MPAIRKSPRRRPTPEQAPPDRDDAAYGTWSPPQQHPGRLIAQLRAIVAQTPFPLSGIRQGQGLARPLPVAHQGQGRAQLVEGQGARQPVAQFLEQVAGGLRVALTLAGQQVKGVDLGRHGFGFLGGRVLDLAPQPVQPTPPSEVWHLDPSRPGPLQEFEGMRAEPGFLRAVRVPEREGAVVELLFEDAGHRLVQALGHRGVAGIAPALAQPLEVQQRKCAAGDLLQAAVGVAQQAVDGRFNVLGADGREERQRRGFEQRVGHRYLRW